MQREIFLFSLRTKIVKTKIYMINFAYWKLICYAALQEVIFISRRI